MNECPSYFIFALFDSLAGALVSRHYFIWLGVNFSRCDATNDHVMFDPGLIKRCWSDKHKT
jgi:hypothetical protein